MALNVDPHSRDTMAFRRHLNEQVERFRKHLEKEGLPERESDSLRGRIAFANSLLADIRPRADQED